ncbi:UNVERIFIED_CONTAM: Dihydrolipoyl dehydrogenase 1, mitochondrial [Sesamum calycinum]|uniref:Dihydrolipoyl dehydrogenase 1, mitochondrial n=1 Tax=Sesamum calycinum TaxID=2727403 RepID=A0AAW2R834_9LAMI
MAMASIARRKATAHFSSSSYHLLSRTNYSRILSRGFASGSDDNDVVVIGGGPGGYVAAIKAAQLGLKTTCIEKRGTLGGTCLNVGCIPSKGGDVAQAVEPRRESLSQLISLDKLLAKHSFANHGIKLSSVEVDLPAMMGQKDKAVGNLTKGIEGLFKKNKVNYVKGYGKFLSPSEVSVDTLEGGSTIVKGKNIIISTGSDVKSLPGAGYIGLEMGSVWGRLGSEVTVVEFGPDIVPTMDGEVRKQFQRSLEKQKMKFILKTKVVSVDTTGNGVKLTLEPAAGGDQTSLEADVVLVSAGRVPFTAGLELDKIGVQTDKAGRILVNERFATNVPGVYAIGDVIPGPMLAHKAEEDGVACVEYIAGKEGHVDYDLVPGVVYTHPEVASVGKTEEQILAEKETDKILGVHIMAPNAGELIHEAVLALQYGASSEDIARTCHAHPTMSEAVKEAAMATYDKPIHI